MTWQEHPKGVLGTWGGVEEGGEALEAAAAGIAVKTQLLLVSEYPLRVQNRTQHDERVAESVAFLLPSEPLCGPVFTHRASLESGD